ncbi:Tfiih basal transcription factor complex p44 subunit [Daphnia magna]|uniref:Tfiih basal transcription factor complex p44 subunit n=1 Tax=Daphnia magna TaxID=35525 RepID=A0A164NIE1_9CRUS|nr:Tfiih basal transcription factor complex p44 subunit [Daphnia magna]
MSDRCRGFIRYRAVNHPALRVFHKCENLIGVQVGLLRLQRLMEKPSSSR